MPGMRVWSPVLELRQYALHPGARDVLIDLFDAEFVETQEADGMDVVGQFRDLDEPDRFVWLRGFPSMERRADSLAAFYGGPVWKAHRDAANATMISSDDVLLLRPTGSGFALDGERRGDAHGLVAAWITPLADADEPSAGEHGGSILASFVTEPSENTFPALPVRDDGPWFVTFAGFPDGADLPAGVLQLAPTSRSLLHGGSPARKDTP